MTKIPFDEILESLYKLRIRESDQLKSVLELYDLDIHQKKSNPDYPKLTTVVKRRKDQKLRLRNFDARCGKIESGAVGNSRKGAIGADGRKGTRHQLKEKGQDRCSFPPRNPRSCAKKNRTHCRYTCRPGPFRGGSVSGKRSIRGKSNHGSISREPRRQYSKGTCTGTPCEYWHPPECQFQKTKMGRKAGDKRPFSALQG